MAGWQPRVGAGASPPSMSQQQVGEIMARMLRERSNKAAPSRPGSLDPLREQDHPSSEPSLWERVSQAGSEPPQPTQSMSRRETPQPRGEERQRAEPQRGQPRPRGGAASTMGGRRDTDLGAYPQGGMREAFDAVGNRLEDPNFFGRNLGMGQDNPDMLWDKYQAREVQGAMDETLPPHDLGAGTNMVDGHDLDTQSGRADYREAGGWVEGNSNTGQGYSYENPKTGSSGEGGQGEDIAQGKTYHTGSSTSTGTKSGTPGAPNIGIDPAKKAELAIQQGRLDLDNRHEDNRHEEAMLNARTEQERVAEIARHNVALEGLEQRKQDLDVQMNALDNATKIEIQRMADFAAKELESMKEAHAIRLELMQEGHKILMEQGQEAFKDWQTRQSSYLTILSSALNNPWLQRLTGMAPQGGQAVVMGGGNISALLAKILAPYDYTKVFGLATENQQAPGATDALNQYAPYMPGQGMTGPGEENYTPDWNAWQTWSPYQKAAYRANIEALGPGAWQTQQSNAMQNFAAQGGSPDITALAGGSATPEQSIGQAMTAEMFGQTPEQWQKHQERQWSQAKAPEVKSAIGVSPLGPTEQASPERQLGV